MSNFWEKLPKPFFVLAPMADVTDAAFRRIICKYGKPDVTWTEFVSADGLASPGREVLKYDLMFTEAERPIVAQLFSAHPEKMREASKLVAELGFDGIDINMGCPDRSIEKQGAGAAMIKNPKITNEMRKIWFLLDLAQSNNELPPTLRELQDVCGYKSQSTVFYHLKRMQKLGIVVM
jgi:tRNA-dihydrouridine synthase